MNDILGIIAGGGQFPLMVAESAKKQGFNVVAVAHSGETDPALSEVVDEIVWVKLGQLGRLIKALKQNNVKKALMAGAITKKRMFEDIKPDLKGMSLLAKLAIFHDDDILRAVAGELSKEGIDIISSTFCLPDLLAQPGCITRRKPSKTEEEDIRFGWEIAKEIGRLDIGQCVVVKRKTVLAIEAIEGTDETILRGGELARDGAIIIKVSKPNQDLRFDVPSVGLKTIKTMARARASLLAVEAGKSLMFDKERMVSFADEMGISIVSR
jgi:DUF1009 family protein